MHWTEPTTNEERRYFSKHANERKLFAWFMAALLLLWGVADFYGFRLLLTNAFSTIAALSALTVPVTLFALVALHYGLYTTATTYFYDKMDQDERTDSTIIIPLLITALMLFASREGSHAILSSMAHVAELENTESADRYQREMYQEATSQWEKGKKMIEATYADRIAAARKPHQDKISRLEKSLWATAADNKARRSLLRSQIRAEEEKRDLATAALSQEKADKLAALLQQHDAQRAGIESQHGATVATIQEKNKLEREKELAATTAAKRYSWIISALLALLFWLTAYRYVRINVMSGIVPVYTFTELDQRGGVFTWFKTAILDAFRRQAYRLAVLLHRLLSRGTSNLRSFDGRIMFQEDDYHDPKQPPTPPNNGQNRLNGHKIPLDSLGKN